MDVLLVSSLGDSDMFNNELDKLDKTPIVLNPNITQIPITRLPMNEEGIEEFNRIYFLLKDYCKDFHSIQWTKKHYIKRGRKIRLPQWDVSAKTSGVEITVLCIEGMFRVHLKTGFLSKEALNDHKITGKTAFLKFKNICKNHGIDLNDFSIANGEEVKKTIPKAPVELVKPFYENMIFEHAYHIDLNSSYMSGVMTYYPELAEAVKEVYKTRKKAKADKDEEKNKLYKSILTNTWGYFQSNYVDYSFSHLSKAGILFNNSLLEKITKGLREQGFTIIAYNTDGVWYTSMDNRVYHDENEGEELCQWKHDHCDCKLQMRSARSYHFIEDGNHKVVISGLTRLDKIKPREEWTWGDFNESGAEVTKIVFDFEKGAYFK